MSIRILSALALLIAGTISIWSGVYGLAGIEVAMIAFQIVACVLVMAGGIYCLGAALVMLTHETWVARVVERWTQ